MVLGCAVAAIVLATGQRGTALRAVLRPILTVGGAWVLFGLLDLYTVRVIGPFNGWLLARLSGFPDLESAEPTMSVWFEAAGYFPLLGLGAVWSLHGIWMFVFFLFSVFYLSRYAFRSAEAHPVLPPVIVTVTSWCVFLLGAGLLDPLLEAVRSLGSVPLGVAPTLQLIVSAMGATTVTALASWEIVRLNQRGVTLRTGPWLSTAPPPSVPTHQLRTNRRDH